MTLERVEQVLAAATPRHDPGRGVAAKTLGDGLAIIRQEYPDTGDDFIAHYLSGYLGGYISTLELRSEPLHNLLPRFLDVARAAQRASDKRTADSDGFWISAREMRYIDEALAALDTAIQEELPATEAQP